MSQKTSFERWKKEYIVPLEGKPIFRRKGIIKAVARYGQKVSAGEIIREEFEEEEFQYIIHPYWEIVDGLPASIFQGIPGINMELRQTDYYRVNYEPVFITERSPSKNREDMWKLMQDVGLDYYNRFEWLLRTDMRAGNDNLIAEPIYEEQPEPLVDHMSDLGKTVAKNNQMQGIQKAKEEKKYKGRKKIEISAVMMEEICRGLDNGTIGVKEAMERLHLTSQSTFYRRLREYRERGQE